MNIRLYLSMLFVCIVAPGSNVSCQTWQQTLSLTDSLIAQDEWDSAMTVFERTLEFEERRFGRSDRTVDVKFYRDGVSYRLYYRSFAGADSLYSRLAEISATLYGESSVQSALNLRKLGAVKVTLGQYREAESVFRRALSASEGAFGEESGEVAEILNDLGDVTLTLARYDEADSIARRAERIASRILGDEHPEVARSLQIMGGVMLGRSLYSRADSVFTMALAILEGRLGFEHADVAACLCQLGASHQHTNEFVKAESELKRSLEMRERIFGKEHVEVAASLKALGIYYHQIFWLCSESESLFVRAIDILTRTYGSSHPLVAMTELSLSSATIGLGRYGEAEIMVSRALGTLEKAFGDIHPKVATSLSVLAQIKRHVNQPSESIPLLDRAAGILRARDDSTSMMYAGVLLLAGPMYVESGQRDRAESSMAQGLMVAERLGDSTFLATAALQNARFFGRESKPQAKGFYEKVLAILENLHGGRHAMAAFALIGLARNFFLEGDIDRANLYLSRAMELTRDMFDEADISYASNMLLAAELSFKLGQLEQAESLYLKGLPLLKKIVGPYHISYSGGATTLARVYAAHGKYEESLERYREVLELAHRQMRIIFDAASERERLGYLYFYSPHYYDLLSLTLKHPTQESRELSLMMILRGKAILEEASMATQRRALCSGDTSVEHMLDELVRLRGRTSNMVLSGHSNKDTLAFLYASLDSVETELSRRCSEFQDQLALEDFSLQDVARALPEGAVLIEFFTHFLYDIDSGTYLSNDDGNVDAHFLAFTLDRQGNTSVTDLGSASEILTLIKAAQGMIYDAQGMVYSGKAAVAETKLNEITRQFREIVFDPLIRHFDGKTDLLVSMDGILNQLPLEILPMPDSSYLVENYRITYLSTGRDILRHVQPKETLQDVVIMADPDFNHGGDAFANGFSLPASEGGLPASLAQILRGTGGCLEGPMGRLGYSLNEGKSVAASFRKLSTRPVTEFYGSSASEGNLKRMGFSPSVLHLATHGYFCPNSGSLSEEYENPMLRAGLLLAGYNSTFEENLNGDEMTGEEDGVLTAYEVSALDLSGTELVTLSACESGRSEGHSNEGFYGLRRAFQHAGAQSVIMSLWKVPDRETKILMEGFYERWLSGASKQEALRQSQLSLLRKCRKEIGCGHPLLWGGFILTGNPN
ncbi:MAG: CHAT domain-containing tetratricopeptide repeat protein [Candidatus Zixiibacteriota bacterium]